LLFEESLQKYDNYVKIDDSILRRNVLNEKRAELRESIYFQGIS